MNIFGTFYTDHFLRVAQADRGECGAVRDPEYRDGAGGEVPLLRGLGGELPDPEDLHGGARAGERDERERLGQCGHQHQREVLIVHTCFAFLLLKKHSAISTTFTFEPPEMD